MSNFTSEDIKSRLHTGIIKFRYTKVDGSIRDAEGTLNVDFLIEKNVLPNETAQRNLSDNVVRYYDTGKNSWRSFRPENFVEFING